MNLFEDMYKWQAQPYSDKMSLWGWVAFIGMLIIVTILWNQVIRFIID